MRADNNRFYWQLRPKAELKSLGVENVRDGGLYSLHMTDPFGYDVQISGLANNALTDG